MYVNFQNWGCVFHQSSHSFFLSFFFFFFPLHSVRQPSSLHWFKESKSHPLCGWLELVSGALVLELHLFWVHAPGNLCNQQAQDSWDFSLPQVTRILKVGCMSWCRGSKILGRSLCNFFFCSLMPCHKMATVAPAITSTFQMRRIRKSN